MRAWRDMPIVVPPDGPRPRASAAGTSPRRREGAHLPTAGRHRKDTLDWHKTRPQEDRDKLAAGAVAGISAAA